MGGTYLYLGVQVITGDIKKEMDSFGVLKNKEESFLNVKEWVGMSQ